VATEFKIELIAYFIVTENVAYKEPQNGMEKNDRMPPTMACQDASKIQRNMQLQFPVVVFTYLVC